jgi:ATP-dependent RNA helicase DDX27
VKTGKAQGAKIVSRVVDQGLVEEWVQKVEGMMDEIEEILREEREEKQLAQTEMQVTKGENLIKHHTEIISRPKRTWFESEREKLDARKRGLVELNGPGPVKKEKSKLSGKDKKRLDAVRERQEGRIWKKGKKERESRPMKNGKSKKGGAKNKNSGKGKR